MDRQATFDLSFSAGCALLQGTKQQLKEAFVTSGTLPSAHSLNHVRRHTVRIPLLKQE